MIAAAIFDVDELLISLEPQHKEAERLVVEEMGQRYADLPHEIRTTSGRRVWDVVADMHAHFGWTQPLHEVFARRQALFMALLESAEIAPMPGAAHAVALLHGAGYPLAVASSGVRGYLEAVLQRLGLRQYFDVLVSGEDVTRGKPDPEPYLLAAARLGVRPGQCVVFEDAAVGVRAAKAAGMACIAVPNPAALQPQDLSLADLILPSLEHFELTLLDGLC
jgi:HAD superfamily hydrolase (TIGR01509 family)